AVEPQDGLACGAGGRRNERRHALVDAPAIVPVHAREQVPEGERVARARRIEHGLEARDVAGVEAGEGGAGARRGVSERRRAVTSARARRARRTGGHHGLAALPLEADEAAGDTEEAGSLLVHLEAVGASEVHGDGGRGLDEEEPRRSEDG